jgi:hypothetical protein
MPDTPVDAEQEAEQHGADQRTPERVGRWGPGVWVGVWAVVNVALGVVLAYPFMLLYVIGLHARAMVFDRPDSPFSNKEIQGGEADGFIPGGIIALLVILAVVTAINRPMIRRMRLPSTAARIGIVLVTGGLLVAPFAVIF